MKRNASLVLFFLLLAACSTAPSTSIPENSTSTSTAIPTKLPTDTPAPAPSATPAPVEISSIPGFEGWSMVNAPVVEIASENGDLILTLKYQALWFMNEKGVLAYKPVSGDFKMTAAVYTSKHSNPDQPPGGDGSVQLGGLMARKGNSGTENYVFIVVGDDGNGLSVETKDTLNSFSEYTGPAWDSPDAEMRICRVGQTFHLYKRHIDSSEPWQRAVSFERPDLPEELQVGVNIYTDSRPDLQVRFKDITIQPISSEADCQTD